MSGPPGAQVGERLGILMLDTRFPRIEGDIGHAATFDPPALRRVVRGASPRRAVIEQDAALLAPFVEAGRALVADGCTAVTTSCGFLVRFQRALQDALTVPVWTSSLLALRGLDAALAALGRGQRAGVVTVDAASLDGAVLEAAGASPSTPVEGLAADSAFRRTLLEDLDALDVAEARAATVAAALRLVERHPGVDAIVLECTNMPPHAAAVAAATGRPVHDLVSLLRSRPSHRNPSP